MTRADRLIRKAHLWLGLCMGALLVIFGATGALLEYQRPLWIAEFGEPAQASPVPVSRWIAAARDALPEGSTLAGIMMPEGRLRMPWALVTAQDHKGEAWIVLVDPGTGTARATRPMSSIKSLLPLRLHVSLALDGPVGIGLTIASGVALALSSVTALAIWARSGRLWRKATTFEMRGVARRRNFRLHTVVGFWTSAALLALGLTGAWLAQPFGFPHFEPAERVRNCGVGNIDALVAAAQVAAPRSTITTIEFPSSGDGHWRLSLRTAADSDQVLGDRLVVASARCTSQPKLIDRHERSTADRVFGVVRSFHSGHVLGRVGEFAVLLAGLALVVLPISGALHWWRTRPRPARSVQKSKRPSVELSLKVPPQ